MSYNDVVKSKVYIGSVVGRVMDVLAFKGYMTFLPKFLENHFGNILVLFIPFLC